MDRSHPLLSPERLGVALQRRREAHSAFLEQLTRPAWLTLGLVVALVIIWFTVMSGGSSPVFELARHGARVPHLVREGELWRLLTALMLHSSFAHLVSNLSILLVVGWLAEHVYGPRRYLMLLALSGIVGGLCGVVFDSRMSVGISGGVFGVWAAGFVFAHRHWLGLPHRFRQVVGWLWLAVLLYFVGVGVFSPGVDNAAHFGGLVAGLLLAMWLECPGITPDIRLHRPAFDRIFLFFLLIGLVSCAALYKNLRGSPEAQIARLEGSLTSWTHDGFGFTLEHPLSWQEEEVRAVPGLRSLLSGVRLSVFAGAPVPASFPIEQGNPVRELEESLTRAIDQTQALEAGLSVAALERRSIGGYPARRLRLEGLRQDGRGRALVYAVWVASARRVVLFMFVTPGALPRAYDDLFEAIMQSVEWRMPGV